MSIALLGLLLLQFYWIKNVYQLAQERFVENVKMSLDKTVLDLERIEMEPLIQIELFEEGLQGSYADFVNREFGDVMKVDESIQIRDTVIIKDGEKYQFLVLKGTTFDTTTGLLAEHRVITKKLGDIIPSDLESSVLSFQDSNSYAIQLSNSFNRQIMRKAHYLDEIMVKMFTGNYFDDIALRLNIKLLDSLLAYNFKRNELDTSFQFNITHKSGQAPSIQQKSANYNPKITSSVFSTLLFPNDIVPGDYQLIIDFPNENAFLWKEMSSTLIASFLLVLIIVFAFYLSAHICATYIFY
jgi:two-component system phosphate regulon sensor histidine kinase PhoR